jgi:hypothetical protein
MSKKLFYITLRKEHFARHAMNLPNGMDYQHITAGEVSEAAGVRWRLSLIAFVDP